MILCLLIQTDEFTMFTAFTYTKERIAFKHVNRHQCDLQGLKVICVPGHHITQVE